MSDSFRIQQNVKVGNDLINLRADNPEEFKNIAEWTVANAALFVNVQAALAAVPPALAGNVTNTQVINDAPARAVSGWQNQQQAPPSYAQPAAGPGPACKHGQMIARQSKPGAPKQWSGHFCPTPQGTPDQCPPQFAKR